jgi:hypothetical protein
MLLRVAPVVVLLPLVLAALGRVERSPAPDTLEPVVPTARSLEAAAPVAEPGVPTGREDGAGWGTVHVVST